MNLWLYCPLIQAVAFMIENPTKFEVRSHVLRIGPLAFIVCWKRRITSPPPAQTDKE